MSLVFRNVFLLLFLLLEALFTSSAALTVNERQRDDAAGDKGPKRVRSGAADEAPQPPQNLVVFPQSDTSIMLTWSAPSDTTDFDHYFVYVEDEDMETTTDYTYYIFNNLEPCTDYTFGVMSVSAAGDTSDPLLGEGQTEAGTPAPQNLEVDGYTGTTVTLSWDKPDTLCDVEEYRVKWDTDGTDTQSTRTSETSFTVTELSINTIYIFSVFASTSYGEGPEATVQQTTDATVGGPPENLVAVGVSSSAINVSWSPPADEPVYYLVSAPPCMIMEDMVSDLSYLITGLDPCETCQIYVTSYYDNTQEYTASVNGATDAEDPPPPESCSVQVEGDGLRVTWVKAVSDCSLGQYRVQWTGTKLWGDGGEESGSVTTSGTTYYVIDTVPYSQYTFEISSSIDGVFGSPSSCSGTSSETQPGPPVTVAVDSVQGEAVVTWETPVEENGVIVNYGIFVDEATDPHKTVSGDIHSTSLELEPWKTFGLSVKAKNGAGWGQPSELKNVTVVDDDDGVPDPPQNLLVQPQSPTSIMLIWQDPDDTTDLDHYLVYVEGEDMQGTTKGNYYLVESLEPCTDYTFGVMSVSVEGNTSDPILENGETGIGAPPAPQNLTVDGYTSTNVTLSWDDPDTLCDVDEYRVKWIKDGFDIQNERTNETSFTVTGLSIDTTYTFAVAGITEYGTGEEASVQQTTKLFDGGPPENLVAVGVSESEVNVSWTPPTYEPSYYLLTALPCTYLEENVFGLSYLITGLDPCDSCSVSVTSYYNDTFQYTAQTLGSSQGGDPPPPESCSVEVQAGAITVEWQRPDTNCLLGIYSGHWTGTKLWGDGEEVSGSRNTSETSISVFDPVPYSRYTFEISASIDGVFGSPASCSGTSQETEPGSPVIVDVDSVQGEAVVTWETPAEENGLIVQYRIFVDEKTEPYKIVNGDVHSTSLTLDPCETYSLSIEARNGAGWGPPSEAKDVTVVGDVLPETVDCSASDFNVEVCWDPYDETCPVSQYNLIWEGDVLWSEELFDANSTSLEWSTNRTCQSIAAFPYTTYYVELTVGSGTDYRNCSVTTPMAAPGPPADVSVTTEDLIIRVTWHEPEEKNGVIAFYQVEWEILNGGGSSQSTGDTFYDIPGLECGVTVDVTVRAQVEEVDEFGERSSPQRAHLANSVENLDCEPSGSGQVSLSWTVTNPECPISSYNVTWVYESLWSDNAGQGWQDAGKDETSTDVTSLPPYANVSIQVHVDNNPEYTECYAITPEEKPGPPVIVAVDSVQGEAVITWETPANENGLIAEYGIFVDEATEPQKTVSGDVHITSLELEPCKTFGLSVKAKNGAGWGTPSEVKNVTLVDDVPVPPENCSVQVEESVLTVTWERPDTACVQGTYSYRVDWTSTKLWGNGEVESDSKNTTATNTSVVDPVPYCEYLFNVSSSVNGVIGKQSAACGGTSLEAPASPPTDLVQVAMDISSVTVQWSLPESLRGRLLGWYLNWTTAIGHYLGEQDVTNPEERMLQIGDLDPSEVYNVYVMAVNGAGKGELAMLEASTEYVP